jgi:hypothetical protein
MLASRRVVAASKEKLKVQLLARPVKSLLNSGVRAVPLGVAHPVQPRLVDTVNRAGTLDRAQNQGRRRPR